MSRGRGSVGSSNRPPAGDGRQPIISLSPIPSQSSKRTRGMSGTPRRSLPPRTTLSLGDYPKDRVPDNASTGRSKSGMRLAKRAPGAIRLPSRWDFCKRTIGKPIGSRSRTTPTSTPTRPNSTSGPHATIARSFKPKKRCSAQSSMPAPSVSASWNSTARRSAMPFSLLAGPTITRWSATTPTT